MADIYIHVGFQLPFKAVKWGLTCLILLTGARELGSESVILNTYYPSPSAIYVKMIATADAYLARDSGSVGIGTSAPAQKLDVNGDVHAVGYYVGSANTAYVSVSAAAGNTGLGFYSNGAERMSINNSGQVSIGIPSGAAPPANFLLTIGDGSSVGAMLSRQTQCGLYSFPATPGNTPCSAATAIVPAVPACNTAPCYVTAMPGILSKCALPGRGGRQMICCPCGGGACPIIGVNEPGSYSCD